MRHYKSIAFTLLFLGLIVFVFSNHFYQYNTVYDWMNDNDFPTDNFSIQGVYYEKKVNDNGYFNRITIHATSIDELEVEHLFVYSYSFKEKVIFHIDSLENENNMYEHYRMAVYQDNEISPLLNGPFWIVIGYLGFVGFAISLGFSFDSVVNKTKAKTNC